MRWLLLDNYDSFTFNLFQLIADLNGSPPIVARNDALSWDDFCALDVDAVVVSPGPGHPDRERDFGICRRVIAEARVPVLGVCLGHQGIGSVFGARVVQAAEPVHGRVSAVYHTGTDILEGLPQGFGAVRYHSLIVTRPLPDALEEIAWTADGIVMGLRHRSLPRWGVQFHPESICTEHGKALLENFQRIVRRVAVDRPPRTLKPPQPRRPAPPPELRAGPPARLSGEPESGGNWCVRFRRLAEFVDPEEAFLRLYGQCPVAFWLDSSRSDGDGARFSFMGDAGGPHAAVIRYFEPSGRLSIRPHDRAIETTGPLFPVLKQWLAERACSAPALPFDFIGGLVGYFGYELKAECGARRHHESPAPDCTLVFADRIVAFDHLERAIYLVAAAPADQADGAESWFDEVQQALAASTAPAGSVRAAPQECVVFHPELSRERYLQTIAECQRHIRSGESYEICLTTQLNAVTQTDPFDYYTVLRRLNPAPYAAFLRFGDLSVASSSPERFLRIRADGAVESKPIKGTLRRGATLDEDNLLREQLATDVKSRSENLMIVDLLRNDLGTVCAVGSVCVPKLMQVESYATVHQLVSTIAGRLKPGVTALDCFQHAFPGGSMTGAPKLRTMELIDELEAGPRGVYSGALGYFSVNGAADLNIVIRTAVFRDGVVSVGTGGAVIALSEQAAEFEELVLKARALVDAFRAVAGDATIDVDSRAPTRAPRAAVRLEEARVARASFETGNKRNTYV